MDQAAEVGAANGTFKIKVLDEETPGQDAEIEARVRAVEVVED